jgi:hypothetical protein
MTEEWLIQEGFEKITVPHAESDNGYDYYYYSKELCNDLDLYTIDNVDVVDDNWEIKCWEIPTLVIRKIEHYQQLRELISILICE